MADATLKDVMEYFGKGANGIKGFQAEWSALTDADKADLKVGIGNGSFTY